MKAFLITLFTAASFSSAFSYQISATVIFENNTEKTSISGVFYIPETEQSIPINSLDKFTVDLPKKGNYHFEFYSDEVDSFTSHPVKITERQNTVTIRLENKTAKASASEAMHIFPLKDISDLSIEAFEEGIELGMISFIIHGLVAPDAEEIAIFKKEYGIGFTSENCVVDPMSFKIAVNNNKKIEAYLTSEYGNEWKNTLPATPFGLQSDSF